MRSVMIVLATMALVASPAWADFVNLGFEDGTTGWSGGIEQSSTIHDPGGPKEGANWGSVQSGGQNINKSAYQTSSTAFPSEIVTLTGWVGGGTLGGTPADLYVQLLDGSSVGSPVLDEWRVTLPTTYGFGWVPFTLTGHVTSDHTTIKFGISTSSAWSSGTAVHVDGLEYIPEPTSLALFGLVALPLLRRRR